MAIDYCPETKTCAHYKKNWCGLYVDEETSSRCPCAQCILKSCCSEPCDDRIVLKVSLGKWRSYVHIHSNECKS